MSAEYWWHNTEIGRPKYSEKNLSLCDFLHHKSHTGWPGYKPAVSRSEPAKCLKFGTAVIS
jgi:hypothetical protein